MTHDPQMVERVALPVTKADRDLWKSILDAPFATCVQINNLRDDCPELQAIAHHRVETSHHADLVEELAEVTEVAKGCAKREARYFADRKELLLALKRSRLALNLVPANDKRFDPANHAAIKKVADIIDEALAKIGGDA